MVVRSHRRRQRGLALLDGLVGAGILVLGASAYFSLVPVIHRSQLIAEQQTIAVQIGNRMIEHLLLLKPSSLNGPTLTQLNLIDSGQVNAPFKFSNLPMDHGWVYSPSKALVGGVGELSIKDLKDNSKLVVVEITWDGPNKQRMSYKTGTILGGYR